MKPEIKFKTEFTVRVGDINYGGHMGNDKYLLLFHDVRIRFLESMGFSEIDIGEGAGLIMSEAGVRYRGEAFLGDKLSAGIMVTGIKGAGFNLEYEVERISDGKTIATGFTRMAAFDYTARKICRIPPDFLKHIEPETDVSGE